LSLEGTAFDDTELQPAHPANMTRAGNLSRRGVDFATRRSLSYEHLIESCKKAPYAMGQSRWRSEKTS
jgi:hypothetical protein